MLDQISMTSDHNIDKIVYQNTISVVNSGATGQEDFTAFIVTGTAPNPYGRKCFARFRWSVDNGTTWQAQNTKIIYLYKITLTSIPLTDYVNGLSAAMSVGCNKDTIFFRTANGLHGDVIDNGVTTSYTPIPQTFLIEYSIFEEN